jgi:hypothetical protein
LSENTEYCIFKSLSIFTNIINYIHSKWANLRVSHWPTASVWQKDIALNILSNKALTRNIKTTVSSDMVITLYTWVLVDLDYKSTLTNYLATTWHMCVYFETLLLSSKFFYIIYYLKNHDLNLSIFSTSFVCLLIDTLFNQKIVLVLGFLKKKYNSNCLQVLSYIINHQDLQWWYFFMIFHTCNNFIFSGSFIIAKVYIGKSAQVSSKL